MISKLIVLSSFFLLFYSNSRATNADLFSYDENYVENEFNYINSIEKTFEINNEVGLSEYRSYVESVYAFENKEIPIGTAFWWGFTTGCVSTVGCWGTLPLFILSSVIVGPSGIVAVYLLTEDKEQTQQAAIGCLVGYASGALINIGLIFMIIGSLGYYGI